MKFNEAVILTRLVNGVLTIIEIFLVLRILLMLFDANPASGFVSFIYQSSQPLLAPFQNIFPSPVIQGQYVLDFSALFALVIYGVVAWLINELVIFIADASTERKHRSTRTTVTKEEE
jgi:uncharacterized protein YggT (Ycf19 family)